MLDDQVLNDKSHRGGWDLASGGKQLSGMDYSLCFVTYLYLNTTGVTLSRVNTMRYVVLTIKAREG